MCTEILNTCSLARVYVHTVCGQSCVLVYIFLILYFTVNIDDITQHLVLDTEIKSDRACMALHK